MNKLMKKLQYAMGLVMTSSLLMINIGSSTLAFSNIILVLMYILLFFQKKIYISMKNTELLVLSGMFIFSYLINISQLGGEWLNESKQAAIKLGLFILPLVIITNLQNYDEFFRGLKHGCFVQLIWGIAQFLLYRIKGIVLNVVVFNKMFSDIGVYTLAKIQDGNIRLTGISWEPANYSLVLILGYILSENIYIKMLYVIVMLLSTSRTGLVVMISVIMLDYFLFNKNKKKISKKMLFVTCVSLIAAVFVFIKYNDVILSTYYKIVGYADDSSASRHFEYYSLLPKLWKSSDVIHILFGVGTSASGKPYSEIANIYGHSSYWNPESDFIFILIGNGIVGAVVYYYMLVKLMIKSRENREIFLAIWSVFIGGIGYIYLRSTWTLILICYALTKINCCQTDRKR